MYELAIDELAAMAGLQGARCPTVPPGGLGRVGDITVCDHCDSTRARQDCLHDRVHDCVQTS